MAVQWLPFVFGLIGGGFLYAVLRFAWIELQRRNQFARFTYNRNTDELELKWVQVPTQKRPVQIINGKPAIPLLQKEQKKTFMGRPAFFVDSETAEAFNIDPEPMQHPWPNARDRLKLHESIRQRKIANAATDDDGIQWLKIGAIAGIIAAVAAGMTLVVVYQSFGGF